MEPTTLPDSVEYVIAIASGLVVVLFSVGIYRACDRANLHCCGEPFPPPVERIWVRIPSDYDDGRPGATLEVRSHLVAGRRARFAVPPGVGPGQVIRVDLHVSRDGRISGVPVLAPEQIAPEQILVGLPVAVPVSQPVGADEQETAMACS